MSARTLLTFATVALAAPVLSAPVPTDSEHDACTSVTPMALVQFTQMAVARAQAVNKIENQFVRDLAMRGMCAALMREDVAQCLTGDIVTRFCPEDVCTGQGALLRDQIDSLCATTALWACRPAVCTDMEEALEGTARPRGPATEAPAPELVRLDAVLLGCYRPDSEALQGFTPHPEAGGAPRACAELCAGAPAFALEGGACACSGPGGVEPRAPGQVPAALQSCGSPCPGEDGASPGAAGLPCGARGRLAAVYRTLAVRALAAGAEAKP